ncbi:8.6 kDa transglutaminase substrate-like [Dermacentor albipictus]|uniref:8.6 kDa transglutaminase substrate-like n=1 Tax=Dermacentor albipictus TaxID=60249 RepID=UPI0038FC0058
MKAALVALLFIAVAALSVTATSIPNCAAVTCTAESCQPVECACGTYKDHCGCCDICYKCPGDQCNSWILDRCTEGHRCVLEDPSKRFELGGKGHCTPEGNTETSQTS